MISFILREVYTWTQKQKLMLFLPSLMVVCLVACSQSPVEQREFPPLYYFGDVVMPKVPAASAKTGVVEPMRIGIVISRTTTNGKWQYRIMHQDLVLPYYQDDLVLIEKFDWNKTYPAQTQIAPVAEITKDEEVLP